MAIEWWWLLNGGGGGGGLKPQGIKEPGTFRVLMKPGDFPCSAVPWGPDTADRSAPPTRCLQKE